VRHFTLESGSCKCFKHLHTFHCDEEEGSGVALVRVHCHQELQEEEDGAPHLNYYHQRNTMAAIRNRIHKSRVVLADVTDLSAKRVASEIVHAHSVGCPTD
jgi:hypothetical protein